MRMATVRVNHTVREGAKGQRFELFGERRLGSESSCNRKRIAAGVGRVRENEKEIRDVLANMAKVAMTPTTPSISNDFSRAAKAKEDQKRL